MASAAGGEGLGQLEFLRPLRFPICKSPLFLLICFLLFSQCEEGLSAAHALKSPAHHCKQPFQRASTAAPRHQAPIWLFQWGIAPPHLSHCVHRLRHRTTGGGSAPCPCPPRTSHQISANLTVPIAPPSPPSPTLASAQFKAQLLRTLFSTFTSPPSFGFFLSFKPSPLPPG